MLIPEFHIAMYKTKFDYSIAFNYGVTKRELLRRPLASAAVPGAVEIPFCLATDSLFAFFEGRSCAGADG
jgi:hypothetical protein